MNKKYKLTLSLLSIFALLVPSVLLAAPIEYKIFFTQTFFHQNFGARTLEGTFFIDDSIIGAGFENQNYGPFSPEMSSLTNFTVKLDGSTTYNFDLAFTQLIVSPPISTVIATDLNGEAVDIQGGLTLQNSLSQIILGRDGNEGQYVDVQQIDSFTSVAVSRGTYVISRVSAVPLPAAIYLFTFGLVGLLYTSGNKILKKKI